MSVPREKEVKPFIDMEVMEWTEELERLQKYFEGI